MYVSRIIARNYGLLRHVDVTLPEFGAIALVGENGAGKTTFMELFDTVQYGWTSRGARGAAVLNEREQAPAMIHFEFSEAGRLVGWLERTIDLNGWDLQGVIRDVQLQGTTPTEREAHLQRITRIDRLTWFHAFHASPRYAFLPLGQPGRAAALDAVADALRYERAGEAVRADARAAQKMLAGVDAEMVAAREARRSKAAMFGRARAYDAALAGARAHSQAQAQTHAAALEELERLRGQSAGVEAELVQIDYRLAAVRQRIGEIEEAAGPDIEWRISDLMHRGAGADHAAHHAQTDLDAALTSGVCPTCQRAGMPSHGADYLRQQVEGARVEAESLGRALTAAREAQGRRSEALAAVPQLRGVEARLLALRAPVEARLREINAEAHGAVARRDATTAAAEPAPVQESAVQWLATSAGDLQAYVDAARNRRGAEGNAARAMFWLESGFSRDGLRCFARARALPIINAAARRYASTLTSGRRYPRIDTHPEEGIVVTLINGDGSSRLDFSSAGEQQTYDLPIFAAMNDAARARAGSPIPTLLLDEVFSHISPGNLADVALWLRELGGERQVLFAAHQPRLTSEFEHQIRFEKHGGATTVTTSRTLSPGDRAPKVRGADPGGVELAH